MQTQFTAEQLRDPDIAVANGILRRCVHCGLCTATCPTFVLLGDELDSPRGRIYLIKDMLENGRPATAEVVRHLDRCLSCLSCLSTCPSGVDYTHLIDHARTHIERSYRRSWHDRALRAALAAILPYPRRLRAAIKASRLVRVLGLPLPGKNVLAERLRAWRDLAGVSLPPSSPLAGPRIHRAEGTRRGRAALLAGCAQITLAPAINDATIRLLTRLGIEVVVAPGAGCCGALTHHLGKHEAARTAAKANIAAWMREIESEGLEAVVANASGCGTMLKDYGFLLRLEAEPWRSRAAKISAISRDISEYLVALGYAPTRPEPHLRVAYHSACSLQHGQKITTEPKLLLRRAGFEVVEPREAHLCCGSAGTYNMLEPAIASRLRARKLGHLKATASDVVAAGNIGCLIQLAQGGLKVVHTVELLDWMAGGPLPAAL